MAIMSGALGDEGDFFTDHECFHSQLSHTPVSMVSILMRLNFTFNTMYMSYHRIQYTNGKKMGA